MIQDLRKRMETKIEKMQEVFTKDLEDLKNKQMNNTLEGINSRMTELENRLMNWRTWQQWWKSLPQNRI